MGKNRPRLRASLDARRYRSAFDEACEWADRIDLCLSHARGMDGDQRGWHSLETNIHKVRLAIVSTGRLGVEPKILRQLYSRLVLRIAPGDRGVIEADLFLVRFYRDDLCRALLLPGGLDSFDPKTM